MSETTVSGVLKRIRARQAEDKRLCKETPEAAWTPYREDNPHISAVDAVFRGLPGRETLTATAHVGVAITGQWPDMSVMENGPHGLQITLRWQHGDRTVWFAFCPSEQEVRYLTRLDGFEGGHMYAFRRGDSMAVALLGWLMAGE